MFNPIRCGNPAEWMIEMALVMAVNPKYEILLGSDKKGFFTVDFKSG